MKGEQTMLDKTKVTPETVADFIQSRITRAAEKEKELSQNTLEAYKADMGTMQGYFAGKKITRGSMKDYRAYLEENFKPQSVNRKIRTANQYVEYAGLDAKVQNVRLVRNATYEDVMTAVDLRRMFRYADKLGRPREKAIMETLVATGIRFGELKYFTYEAVKAGHVTVENKGSRREIAMPQQLRKLLKAYCKEAGITSGIIFRTRTGKPVTNPQFWRSIKQIAGQARVKKSKIHAHSFRHLFAINYLQKGGNVLDLQNMLGHKRLETTAIYTRTTTKELGRKMTDTCILDDMATDK